MLRTYVDTLFELGSGVLYIPQASGREREDGTWEGWLEFVPGDGSAVLRSRRETTQPSLDALRYWAGGLTPTYLKGALERTLNPPPLVIEAPAVRPVLNPFSVYARGETLLRQQLAALSLRHLRDILVGHALADPASVDLKALTVPAAIELIVVTVRGRLAARPPSAGRHLHEPAQRVDQPHLPDRPRTRL